MNFCVEAGFFIFSAGFFCLNESRVDDGDTIFFNRKDPLRFGTMG